MKNIRFRSACEQWADNEDLEERIKNKECLGQHFPEHIIYDDDKKEYFGKCAICYETYTIKEDIQ